MARGRRGAGSAHESGEACVARVLEECAREAPSITIASGGYSARVLTPLRRAHAHDIVARMQVEHALDTAFATAFAHDPVGAYAGIAEAAAHIGRWTPIARDVAAAQGRRASEVEAMAKLLPEHRRLGETGVCSTPLHTIALQGAATAWVMRLATDDLWGDAYERAWAPSPADPVPAVPLDGSFTAAPLRGVADLRARLRLVARVRASTAAGPYADQLALECADVGALLAIWSAYGRAGRLISFADPAVSASRSLHSAALEHLRFRIDDHLVQVSLLARLDNGDGAAVRRAERALGAAGACASGPEDLPPPAPSWCMGPVYGAGMVPIAVDGTQLRARESCAHTGARWADTLTQTARVCGCPSCLRSRAGMVLKTDGNVDRTEALLAMIARLSGRPPRPMEQIAPPHGKDPRDPASWAIVPTASSPAPRARRAGAERVLAGRRA